MTARFVTALAVLLACVICGSIVRSQDASTLKKDMMGQWELSTTERSKTCVVTLKGDATPQGMKLELEPACAAALPFTKAITAWNVKGLDIVRLQDAAGAPVIDFTEVESGIFEGLRQGEGIYILQNLAAARSLAKSMDQMIGDWAMVRRNGQSICGLTLTNTEATADNFQVFLKPRCDPAVATFAPTMWRLERGGLLLMSAGGEFWRFEADDNAQWRRVPDSADPLIMVRQQFPRRSRFAWIDASKFRNRIKSLATKAAVRRWSASMKRSTLQELDGEPNVGNGRSHSTGSADRAAAQVARGRSGQFQASSGSGAGAMRPVTSAR